MGDGGWRRIDAAAAWHILTRVGLSALATALHGRLLKRSGELSRAAGDSRPYTKGRRFIAPPFSLVRPAGRTHLEVKDPMGVWIATGALGRVRLLNHPLWRRPCKLQLTDPMR